ncbi:MAG TPA: hypothetical protein VGF56_04690 [Rhizomicrobium sp.]|jgi:hypothetical protein
MMKALALWLLILTAGQALAGDATIAVPDGYVPQRLDVTDGAIARPKDWYYSNGGTPSGWFWLISKEPPGDGVHTDMRIQMFIHVSQGAKYTVETFAQHVLAEQQQASDKVLSACAPTPMDGGFTRQCLEVERTFKDADGARRYHAQYSAFWSGDTVFFVAFEAPPVDWNDETKTIAVNMAAFRPFGPNLGK